MLYLKRPEPYHARMDDIIDALDSEDVNYASWMAQLLAVITQEHPELITSTRVDRLITIVGHRTVASHDLYSLFQALGHAVSAQPALFDAHRAALVRFVVDLQSSPAMKCLQQYFVASTIVRGQQAANEYLSMLVDLLKKEKRITNEIRTQIFHTCQLIGVIDKQALEAKRSDLIPFESYSECRMLIDIIDGNKLTEEYQTAMNQTRDQIVQMEKSVIRTEKKIDNVTGIVKRQELKVSLIFLQPTVTRWLDTVLDDQSGCACH